MLKIMMAAPITGFSKTLHVHLFYMHAFTIELLCIHGNEIRRPFWFTPISLYSFKPLSTSLGICMHPTWPKSVYFTLG